MDCRRLTAAALFAVFVAASGCSERAKHSGFLSDYSQLAANPDVEDAMTWENPTKDLSQYNRFIVEPVMMHFAPDAEGVSIDAAKLNELTEYAHEQLVTALSERYQVVSSPGADTLRLRCALTDIKKGNTVLNIIPTTKLTGAGLGGASMEAEALDSVTGERILAVVDKRRGDQFSLEGAGELDNARQVIRHWAERFVDRVDAAHGQ